MRCAVAIVKGCYRNPASAPWLSAATACTTLDIHGDRAATHVPLTDELAGDAVDMESAAIVQVCRVNNVPFVSVRTLSDMADGTAEVTT